MHCYFFFSRAGFLEGLRAAEIRHGSSPRRPDRSLRTVLQFLLRLIPLLRDSPSRSDIDFFRSRLDALRHEPDFLHLVNVRLSRDVPLFLCLSSHFAPGSFFFSDRRNGTGLVSCQTPILKGSDFKISYSWLLTFFWTRYFQFCPHRRSPRCFSYQYFCLALLQHSKMLREKDSYIIATKMYSAERKIHFYFLTNKNCLLKYLVILLI